MAFFQVQERKGRGELNGQSVQEVTETASTPNMRFITAGAV
jgi:hypothetical protein